MAVNISDGRPDAPLKARSSFFIGYGNSGVKPQAFNLRDDLDIEVCYLKLFITNKPVDLRHIRQFTPFRDYGARSPRTKPQVSRDAWATKTAIIIQKRTEYTQLGDELKQSGVLGNMWQGFLTFFDV